MKILVYLDEEDLKFWKEVKETEIACIENKKTIDFYKSLKKAFWDYLLEKYTILRNKQIYIKPEFGYVYDISGHIR